MVIHCSFEYHVQISLLKFLTFLCMTLDMAVARVCSNSNAPSRQVFVVQRILIQCVCKTRVQWSVYWNKLTHGWRLGSISTFRIIAFKVRVHAADKLSSAGVKLHAQLVMMLTVWSACQEQLPVNLGTIPSGILDCKVLACVYVLQSHTSLNGMYSCESHIPIQPRFLWMHWMLSTRVVGRRRNSLYIYEP